MNDPIIRKVDHVFVPVEDPEPLFTVFTGGLGLPVAWPVRSFGAFRSGGVSFGNVNVEFVSGDATVSEYLASDVPAVVKGIAFEPSSIEACVAELDARGLPHTPPDRTDVDGWAWTNVYVGGLIGRAAIAFFCRYHASETMDAGFGLRMSEEAARSPLGVLGAEEIVVGVADLGKAESRWSALFRPIEPEDECLWRAGSGPAIRLRRSPYDGVHGIAVKVRSLDETREALARRDLLGPVKEHSVGIRHPKVWGLDVWFVE